MTDGLPVIWVAETAIVGVLGDHPLIGCARFPLRGSRQVKALLRAQSSPMDQQAFCRLLRLDLDVPAEVLARYRSLRWSSGAQASAVQGHGKESLGREVYAALANADDVPESFVLSIPLYDSKGQRDTAAIRCNVDIDTSRETLRIDPAPGAIQAAYDAHAQKNAERLRELVADQATVVLGDPGNWAKPPAGQRTLTAAQNGGDWTPENN